MWRIHREPNADFVLNLSRAFNRIERNEPRQFPTLLGKTVLVATDYSGGQNDSSYYVVSLLIADLNYTLTWDGRRRLVRAEQLRDNRRISFKALGDRRRESALGKFLDAANEIPGILISFAVHKTLMNLFTADDNLDTLGRVFQLAARWKLKTLRKLILIVGFVTFCSGGLVHDDQKVFWITDDDDFTGSHKRMKDVVNVLEFYRFANMRTHTGEAHCQALSALPNSQHSMLFEDLCSVPDLVAGTFSECVSSMAQEQELRVSSEPLSFQLAGVSRKSKTIFAWHEEQNHPLRRMLCIVTPDPEPSIAFRVLFPSSMKHVL